MSRPTKRSRSLSPDAETQAEKKAKQSLDEADSKSKQQLKRCLKQLKPTDDGEQGPFFWTSCVTPMLSTATATFFACAEPFEEDVFQLKWADWLGCARTGWTPLHYACKKLQSRVLVRAINEYKAWYETQKEVPMLDTRAMCDRNPYGCYGCSSFTCTVPPTVLPVPSLAVISSTTGLLPIHVLMMRWGRGSVVHRSQEITLKMLDILLMEDPRTANAVCLQSSIENEDLWQKYDTPLSLAVRCGQPPLVIKKLIYHGATVHPKASWQPEEQKKLEEALV